MRALRRMPVGLPLQTVASNVIFTACLLCATLWVWLVPISVSFAEADPESVSFAEADPEMVMDTDLSRGINYYRRKMLKPAIESLEKVLASEHGQNDYQANYYLARVYYDKLHIEQSLRYARRAAELAGDESQTQESLAFLSELENFFGKVIFVRAPEQLATTQSGYIYLEPREALVNVEKKEVLERLQESLRSTPVSLPVEVYLPYGEYSANRAPFDLEIGMDPPEVAIVLDAQQHKGVSAWWYVGGAVAAVATTATIMAIVLGGEGDESPYRDVTFGDIPFGGGATSGGALD